MSWVNDGLLDFVFPMIYTNSADTVADTVAQHQQLLTRDACQYWAGLQPVHHEGEWVLTTDQLREQIRVAQGGGAKGAVFIREHSMTEEHLTMLEEF